MARATVAAGSSRGQTTDAAPSVSDGSHTSAGDRDVPAFTNLVEAREALWRGLCDLDDPMTALEGDLSVVEGLSLMVVENHKYQVGPAAQGLFHCATRALDTLRRVWEVQDRLGEAALVVRENDPTRLSRTAARYRPGPHVSPRPPDKRQGRVRRRRRRGARHRRRQGADRHPSRACRR